MENYDDIVECPHCHTNKAIKPDLKFLFSECCGYALCVPCVSQIFNKGQTLRCPNCNEEVIKKKFSSDRLSAQQFQNEVTKRMSIHKVCNLRREDFNTLTQFNDYLEELEDMVYDLAHGNGVERKLAEQRKKDFAEKYRALIEKNKDLQYEEESKKAMMKNKKNNNYNDNDNDIDLNMNNNTQSLHPVFSKINSRPIMCIDNTDSPIIPPKISDAKRIERIQKASGFNITISYKRDQTEVASGLMWFHS